MLRQKYYDNLMQVYEKYGMDVKNFKCLNKDSLCKELNNGKFARGMQCHLGYNYGEKHEYWSYLWTVVEEVVITYKKEQIMF